MNSQLSGPFFSASGGFNCLGVEFWSRFTVTFEFPGRKVFLSKGQCYGRPDEGDYAGLVLALNGSTVIVRGVLNELLLVVRRQSEPQFDPSLGFHLYGADVSKSCLGVS